MNLMHPLFLVHAPGALEPLLAEFLANHWPHVQRLEMAPADFAIKLNEHWQERGPSKAPPSPPQDPPPPPTPTHLPTPTPTPIPPLSTAPPYVIFVSYCFEDRDCAKNMTKAIFDLEGTPYWDEHDLHVRMQFDLKISQAIKTCDLFVLLISTNTERRNSGYFIKEWRQAIARTDKLPDDIEFIIPVVVDDPPRKRNDYRRKPEALEKFTFGHAPQGIPNAALRKRLWDKIHGRDAR
jgi:hypothetical protein